MWFQKTILLKSRPRGFHLITFELLEQLSELKRIRQGLAHFFVQHTSASLTINENADSDVRRDLESHFMAQVPERAPFYRHTLEGDDDMPAHIKATLVGSSLSIPVRDGRLALGTWQGIYLGEHRRDGGARSVVATLHGSSD
ncbi:MAG: secondary thiamine-phosphate synthase enzyme YjbQ [Methylococcus sp.]|nr:secondary thiamine-phosphate synthase enzyme YjbQ [Methylococcus sp.]